MITPNVNKQQKASEAWNKLRAKRAATAAAAAPPKHGKKTPKPGK